MIHMGLFDRFRSSDDNEEESDQKSSPLEENSKGMVNVDSRTEIIHENYGIQKADAQFIAELLKKSIEERSIETHELIDKIQERLGIENKMAWEIRDTEHTSIHIQHTLQNSQTLSNDLSFEWDSGNCSPICNNVAATTSDTHASSISELKGLLREEAKEHSEGTPDRVDHWVPHHQCRSQLLVHTA
jgi:hypothetical protein